MKLQDWVQSVGGIEAAAGMLRIKSHTVKNWYYKKSIPRPVMIIKLIRLSKSQLTLESIVKSTGGKF